MYYAGVPILNQRDHRVAKARIVQLERALRPAASFEDMQDGLSARVSHTRLTTLRAELNKLLLELATYEKLSSTLEGLEASDLGMLPILARASRGLSQRDLADRLGLKEQQVQRYEQQRYSGISLERYERVLAALDVEVQPRLSTTTRQVDSSDWPLELKPPLLKELRRRAWLNLPASMAPSEMHVALEGYVKEAFKLAGSGALHRRTLRASSSDPNPTIDLWRARVLYIAAERRTYMKGRFNLSDTSWLSSLVKLSTFPDGPLRALAALREHGLILVVEPHLPSTSLDGAAMLLTDGIPLIALTLRHDRIDNFWFTLLHELGHIYLHFNNGLEAGFIDDDLDDAQVSEKEREADDFARNWLISDELWRASVARFTRSEEVIERFARSIDVHPAIVAGRIRKERDFRLFSALVGGGQIRSLFAGATERGLDVPDR